MALGGAVALLGLGCGAGAKGRPNRPGRMGRQTPPSIGPWIDCHAHLQPVYRSHGGGLSFDWAGAVDTALADMDGAGISRTVIMPPPMLPDQEGAYDAAELRRICAENPTRFSFMAGGGSLNPMIHQAWLEGSVSPQLERRFKSTAESILAAGAIGIGEMTAEHFSFNTNHPYESVPPDHPMFSSAGRYRRRQSGPHRPAHGGGAGCHGPAAASGLAAKPREVEAEHPRPGKDARTQPQGPGHLESCGMGVIPACGALICAAGSWSGIAICS